MGRHPVAGMAAAFAGVPGGYSANLLLSGPTGQVLFQNLGRRFAHGQGIRRVIYSMFHVVARRDELFAAGWILPDKHVRGGTG